MSHPSETEQAERRFIFLTTFYVALRNARTFERNSATAQQSIAHLHEALSRIHRYEGIAALRRSANFLTLNGVRLKVSLSGLDIYHFLLNEMKSLGLGGISIEPGIDLAELEDAVYLLSRFKAEAQDALPLLGEECQRMGVTHVILEPYRASEADSRGTPKAQAAGAYHRSVEAVRKAWNGASRGLALDVRSVKRAIHETVEMALHDDFYLRSLSNNLRDYDEYTFTHSVNVSLLSISFAMYLGAPKRALGDLGVAALLHDIGKLSVPQEALRAERPLTESEWHLMRRHPIEGALALLRSPGISKAAIDSMAVALEHHRGVEGAGYPTVKGYGKSTIFGMIVSIVDCYDALRTPRPYRPRSINPVEAFRVMLAEAGSKFDPLLLRRFIEFQGFFPVGSFVVLNDGRAAIVCAQSGALDTVDRPTVRIAPSEGEGILVNLAQQGSESDLHIVKLRRQPQSQTEVEEYVAMI
ncbi:MAG: HD domain-containing protein [Armatimonadetes bacterium]|nr:HD domain-containing protein [Armatimonadota bacterium]